MNALLHRACAALAGSLLLALTMAPLLASVTFRRGIPRRNAGETDQHWMEVLAGIYERMLRFAIRFRVVTLAVSVVILGIRLGSLYFIGTEFMPKLDEGSILVETRKLPGVSLTESVEISKRIEQRLRQFPEIGRCRHQDRPARFCNRSDGNQ
jgi:heavy metal efflux system protein